MRYWCLLILFIWLPLCSFSADVRIECYDCGSEDDPDMYELSRTFYRTIKKIGLLDKHRKYHNGRSFEIEWNYDELFRVIDDEYDRIVGYSRFSRYCYDSFADSEPDIDDDDGFFLDTEYDLAYYSHFVDACIYAYSDLRLLYELSLATHKSSLEKMKNEKNSAYEEKLKEINELKENYPKNVARLQKAEKKINHLYEEIFAWCAEHHDEPGAYYQRGLQQFYLGKMEDAVDNMANFIKLAEKDTDIVLPPTAHVFTGKIQAEMGLYHDAINTLSKVIENDPANKEAYLERAFAYFETGDFSLSLNDFITSGYKRSCEDTLQHNVDYAAGLIAGGLVAGSLQGTAQAVAEMPYLVFDSLRGLSHALWSATCKPSRDIKRIDLSLSKLRRLRSRSLNHGNNRGSCSRNANPCCQFRTAQ